MILLFPLLLTFLSSSPREWSEELSSNEVYLQSPPLFFTPPSSPAGYLNKKCCYVWVFGSRVVGAVPKAIILFGQRQIPQHPCPFPPLSDVLLTRWSPSPLIRDTFIFPQQIRYIFSQSSLSFPGVLTFLHASFFGPPLHWFECVILTSPINMITLILQMRNGLL